MNEIAIFLILVVLGLILVNWLLLPFIISKGLEDIRNEIRKLVDKNE